MARGINKVIIVGNCGQDPETRYLPSGGAVTNMSLATSEAWKDKNTGEQQERTEWHKVVFFSVTPHLSNVRAQMRRAFLRHADIEKYLEILTLRDSIDTIRYRTP